MSSVFDALQLQRIAQAIEDGYAGGGSLTVDVTGAGDMQGATAGQAGVHGLVPAPQAGDENKVLSGGGTWIDAGSGGELGDLEDVTITSPTSGESLKYDGTKWVNGNVTAVLPDFIEETSGNIVTVEAAERPAKCLKVAITPVQSGSGDPSPDNIRPISGWTECNVVVSPTIDAEDGTTYPITFPSEAGTVYGGTLDVTNGTLTVTGRVVQIKNLTWGYLSSRKFFNTIPSTKSTASAVACSCYKYGGVKGDAEMSDVSTGIYIGYGASKEIKIKDTNYTDVATLLQDKGEYQIFYELATPITYQLTPTEVQMLLGTNNIWADTGEVKELKYIPQTYNDLLEEMTGGGVDYSTSEQDTGLKWIDGKNVYQQSVAAVNATSETVILPVTVDTIISIDWMVYDADNNQWITSNILSNNYMVAVYFYQGGIYIEYRGTNNVNVYATIKYTKP